MVMPVYSIGGPAKPRARCRNMESITSISPLLAVLVSAGGALLIIALKTGRI